tara:strand:- start:73 stop:285 length:213 start_codon:yes stop_codon:yes gene_type:complete
MSGENITNTSIQTDSTKDKENLKSKIKKKVDINILLNKVRAEEKKEKYESAVFFSLIAGAILVTGLIVSL